MTEKKSHVVNKLEALANDLRKELCLLCGSYSGSVHMGGDMSMADVLTCLYHHTMNIDPGKIDSETRDRFILSKGHGAVCMYLTMAQRGFFDINEVKDTYGKLDSKFGQHPCKVHLPGVESSTGSLGHGLPISVGMASIARQRRENHRVFCLMGDGETCEGSVWEAALLGSSLNLGNLVVIVDRNWQLMTSFSEESVKLEPYAAKWEAFGWRVKEIKGNEMSEVVNAFDQLPPPEDTKPTVVIANTVKGSGIPFMEKKLKWHCGSLNKEDLQIALDALSDKADPQMEVN